MERINKMSKLTTVERKVKLFNSVAKYVLRNDKFVRQHLDIDSYHLVFEDNYNNTYAVRLVQNSNDNNYEVALALRSNGVHLGSERVKSLKNLIELLEDIETKTVLANKALQYIKDHE
jgi:molybdate-binding protein